MLTINFVFPAAVLLLIHYNYIVLGGNAAGLSAASQVKRLKPDWGIYFLSY